VKEKNNPPQHLVWFKWNGWNSSQNNFIQN
jgi:hypothetical protein